MTPETTVHELEVFVWRGQTRYKCPLTMNGSNRPCEFDDYSADTVLEHMHIAHNLTAETEATKVTLFGLDTDAEQSGEEPNIIAPTDISKAVESRERGELSGNGSGDPRRDRSSP